MEASRIMEGDAKTCFKVFTKSIIRDIEDSTAKHIKQKDIHEGYKYLKPISNQLGQTGSVEVIISQYLPPTDYTAEFHSKQGVNYISYKIETVDENRIIVKYKEYYKGRKKSFDFNYKLMNWVFSRRTKKKSRLVLDLLQREVESESRK